MSELAFPVAAVIATFLLLIPLLTLLSRAALKRRRTMARTLPDFGSDGVFALLIVPVLLPFVWLLSSALHQAEPATAAESCLTIHTHATTCVDALVLIGLLMLGSGAAIAFRARRERLGFGFAPLSATDPRVGRVLAVAARSQALSKLRVDIVENAPEAVFTIGIRRPRIVLDASFAAQVDDDVLLAAMLHECAHMQKHDTLRGFVARLCLWVNPAARLIAGDYEQWRRAREALCDREAVSIGGDPLALAAGIVRAARLRRGPQTVACGAMLCGHDAAVLRLRVSLLSHTPPAPRRAFGHIALAVVVLAAITVPHVPGAGLLERFHYEVERVFHTSP